MEHVECGGEDQIGRIEYLARQLQAPDAAARACSTALGAATPASGAAAVARLLHSTGCRGSRARRPDRLAQAKNKIAERANMEGKR